MTTIRESGSNEPFHDHNRQYGLIYIFPDPVLKNWAVVLACCPNRRYLSWSCRAASDITKYLNIQYLNILYGSDAP